METRLQKLLQQVRSSSDEKELFKLAQTSEPAVSLEMARSSKTPERILEVLSRHVSIVIRHAVALNAKTSKPTLQRLSEDQDQLVRDYARRNLLSRTKKNN